MPTGRAVLLLRRLSTGDNRLKNINLNQNTKEPLIANPICNNRDLGFSKRLTTFGHNSLVITQFSRCFCDNKIKMTSTTPDSTTPRRTNRLFTEKSPYLLQHAHNPVQWYPWCQEAVDKARNENKLIFLSVGYSTCHWCHVMEKDSFENEDVAKIMNEHYVNIKVDREERPDIDRIYMLFVTGVVGRGGWPMSVFLTPELRPVTGGTFFPREDNCGRPGFKTILLSLARKWNENRDQIMQTSINCIEAMQRMSTFASEELSLILNAATWDKCVRKYIYLYEPEFGGFGLGPKFPQASLLSFLFHYYARDKKHHVGQDCLDMCLYTLTNMAKGGIHDHVNGGFARYSVDGHWHVPHFEKMLYDQAQLVAAYTDGFLASKDEFYADVVRGIIQYVNRDLRHESGGYYSAEDADSFPEFGAPDKVEGAFCVWEYSELKQLLYDKKINSISYFDIFCDHFNVEEDGNVSPIENTEGQFTNKNVLIIYGCEEDTARNFGLTLEQFNQIISECLGILYEARLKRPRPHLDTKMLCSWNGLMISGLAQAGQGLGEKNYVDDAIKTANFIKEHLYDPATKTLLHSCYKADDGSVAQTEIPIRGFLDDYAFLIKGLLDLYEASFDSNWLTWALELQQTQNELFWDPIDGGYYNCTADDNTVLLRLKSDQDGAEPSGNSVACYNLQRLAAYADKSAAPEGGEQHRERAERLLKAFVKKFKDVPESLPALMSALMFYHDSPTQVLISGGRTDPRTLELVRVVRSRLLPGRVLCVADPAVESPVVLSRIRSAGDVPTAYVCRRYACSLPVTDVRQLESILDEPPAPVMSPPTRR